MAILEVIKMGHPSLRKRALEVSLEEIKTPDFQEFVNDLIETMRDEKGVGIAAPQVGVLKRVFIMECLVNDRYPDRGAFELRAIVNPEIQVVSNNMVDSWEGCLSIPGIRGRAQRFESIKLTGRSATGEPISENLTGFEAIVAQHELDHLDGVLFLDRMENLQTLTFQEEYDKYWTGI